MMRALDSRRATGHDSRVAVKQRPGVRARIGAAKSRNAIASGFFHGLVRPLWAAGQGEPQGSPALYRSVNLCSVAHPFDSGSAVQKPQLEHTTMTTTDLVPVFTGTLAGQSTPLCNARDLHAALGVGTKFEDWLPRRIAEYGFTEGEDFLSILRKTRGRPATDYHLTLDTAKELAIVENNEVGRRIRRYLIALEKDSRAATVPAKLPAPTPPRRIRTRDDLSFTARDSEGRLINWHVPRDPLENWGEKFAIGQSYLAEIAELATHDEQEACRSIQYALSGGCDFGRGDSTTFTNQGWGQECGFAEAIARAVIEALRERRHAQTSAVQGSAPSLLRSSVLRLSHQPSNLRDQILRVVRQAGKNGLWFSHLAIHCQAFRSMTQEQRLAAVESLIVEGLITVKIGPRGGSSLFLAGFE